MYKYIIIINETMIIWTHLFDNTFNDILCPVPQYQIHYNEVAHFFTCAYLEGKPRLIALLLCL